MMYGHCGSGAYVPGPVTTAFQSYFGMASGMDVQHRNSYTATSWFAMLQQDLNAGHPGFYTIASHAIVLDGYRVSGGLNQIHMNYGWSDSHNAWYTVDGLYCTWSGCNPLVEQVIRYIYPAGGTPPPSSSLTVSSPNGGESFASGTTQTISWSSSNLSEAVKIELNRSYPSASWETLVASTSNSGSYSWTVSGAASSSNRIRIIGTVHTSVGDTSNANFTITVTPPQPSSLTLTSPNGGESWASGSTYPITWTSSNFSGNVALELNRTYPSGSWVTLASSVANTGSYNWAVSGAASTSARVRIHGVSNSSVGDTSNANFTITASGGGSSITVLSPNGGESFRPYTWMSIHWMSSNISASAGVRIQINRNYPTGTWETVIWSTPNDGAYSWPVNGTSSNNARLRISLVSSPATNDVSNSSFAITGPFGNDYGMQAATELQGASPNPFNPTTRIRFNLAEAAHVTLQVYDVTGRQVANLMDAEQEAGTHSVTLDGINLATGLYFVRMTAGNYHDIRKIQLLK
jgi:hypothetical protein